MPKRFQKKVEDFVCEHCGAEVKGNGYTNHCPVCLWSKHVDDNPGDRESKCGGMMAPVAFEQTKGEFELIHKCTMCGHEKRNKLAQNDNFDLAVKIVKRI